MPRSVERVKKDLRVVKWKQLEANKIDYPEDEIEKLKEEERILKRELFGARLEQNFERMGERNEKYKGR